jgi:hypothetical protein
MIYSYQKDTPINSHTAKLDSLDVRKLLADSRKIGPFYSTIPPIPFVFYGYALGLLLLILSLISNFWFWRNAKKTIEKRQLLSRINSGGRNIFEALHLKRTQFSI